MARCQRLEEPGDLVQTRVICGRFFVHFSWVNWVRFAKILLNPVPPPNHEHAFRLSNFCFEFRNLSFCFLSFPFFSKASQTHHALGATIAHGFLTVIKTPVNKAKSRGLAEKKSAIFPESRFSPLRRVLSASRGSSVDSWVKYISCIYTATTKKGRKIGNSIFSSCTPRAMAS